MRHVGVCTALAVLIVICLVFSVEGRNKGTGQGRVAGRITGLNPGTITIARGKPNKKRPPRIYSFALTPQTTAVLANGRPAPPNALQMGVHVRVAYQVAGRGVLVATQIKILGR